MSLFPKNLNIIYMEVIIQLLDPHKLSEYFDQNNLNYEVFDLVLEAYDSLQLKQRKMM